MKKMKYENKLSKMSSNDNLFLMSIFFLLRKCPEIELPGVLLSFFSSCLLPNVKAGDLLFGPFKTNLIIEIISEHSLFIIILIINKFLNYLKLNKNN
jgi:hypothetical protein